MIANQTQHTRLYISVPIKEQYEIMKKVSFHPGRPLHPQTSPSNNSATQKGRYNHFVILLYTSSECFWSLISYRMKNLLSLKISFIFALYFNPAFRHQGNTEAKRPSQ